MDLRQLTERDVPLLVEATSAENGRALWGHHIGPYSPADAEAALREWDHDMSFGVVENERMVAAVGLMPDSPASAELAYWVRPEERGRGLAVRALRHLTEWAHNNGFPRVWLEIRPGNKVSLRVAERAGYTYEQRLPNHCEDPTGRHDCLIWTHETPPA